ncbi:MAG: GH92 family glycosyl hydrolase [Leeuwenhoekiella sp.]
MNKNAQALLAIILVIAFSCTNTKKIEKPVKNTSDYVDVFIGAGGHGHTFPGATSPFGMLQPSPDNGVSGWDWCSGYHITDSIISGFSNLHLSGTGIGDLADVLLMPVNKDLDLSLFGKSRDSLPYKSGFKHDSEHASPGYYKVHLDEPDVEVELTASDYVAFHKYTFNSQEKPSFIIDLGFAINWDKPTKSYLKVEDENHIVGYRYSTGWAKNEKVFFIIETSAPITNFNLRADKNISTKQKEAAGTITGGQFFLGNISEMVAKIALSSVSVENARENLYNSGKNSQFEEAKTQTQSKWESVLSNITVETPVDSLKTIFYTALYHTQLSPVLFNDSNGQLRLQNDSIVKSQNKVYSTLSLWDIFRAETPLLNIMNPDLINDMVNSMLIYYDEKGSLPVWTLYANETNTMTGNHAVSVIADAFMKGNRNYDVEKAYEAVRKTMMGDERGLKEYKEFGYVPYTAIDESVTITLEFAYNDYCVAQMAKELGKTDDYEYFLKRSEAYKYVFDPATGFMRGKSADGVSFREPFDPAYSSHREATDYTEGNAWQHSWFVLHDVEGLIKLQGGDDAFVKKLDQLFTTSSEVKGDNASPDISGLIGQYAHGNEPSHHIAYMFNKANAPWKTQERVREILNTQYSVQPDGLSGNEDCGQMSAWYVFSSLGLYPMNPASAQYEISSPLFTKATIKVGQDKNFTILAQNTSFDNKYIQSVKLNGKPLNRTYILHEELMRGGVLEFEMGNQPNKNWAISK